jgi:hypothetical protein
MASPERVDHPSRWRPGAQKDCGAPASGQPTTVFFRFSSRLGCLGSLAVSAVLTLVLLLVFDVL